MRSKLMILGVSSLLLLGSGCTAIIGSRIDPGYSGLLVDNYGDEKGIQNATLYNGGRVTYNPVTQDLYQYPVFFRTYQFAEAETVAFSVGGSKASMDLGVTYRFRVDPVDSANPEFTYLHQFFRNYRVDPDAFNAGALRNALRDCANESAAGTSPVQIATNPAGFQEPLLACLNEKFPELEIKEVSLLNPPVLPQQIQDSIDAAFKANQDAETARANAARAEAEGKAKVAEAQASANVRRIEAQAEAEANGILSRSITPALLERERLEIERLRAEKWNGQYAPTIQSPNVQLGNQTANPPAP